MPNNQRQQKHLSVGMNSAFYSYSTSNEVKYITVQYWNGGIYLTFTNRITDENVEEISYRMPEHVIKDFSMKLGNIMLKRRNAYIEQREYDDENMVYHVGTYQDDKIILDGIIRIYTVPVMGKKRIVLEAEKGNFKIPIIFHSDYIITDVSPENQNKLRYIDLYDTKIWSLYQALQTSSSPLYRAIYNTAEQIVRSITNYIDSALKNKQQYPSRGNYSYKNSSEGKNMYGSDKKLSGDDEIPF